MNTTNLLIIFVAFILFYPGKIASQNKITPDFREMIMKADPDEKFPVLIAFGNQGNERTVPSGINHHSKEARQMAAAQEIRNRAEVTFANALSIMEQSDKVSDARPIAMALTISAKVTPDIIDKLIKLPEVVSVTEDITVPIDELLDTVSEQYFSFAEIANEEVVFSSSTIVWGVDKINAPKVWQDFGVTGDGITVAVFDTGCDYTHPDLINSMWDGSSFTYQGVNLDYHGWNFILNTNDPMDTSGDSHGTKSAGIVTGDGSAGIWKTGVAPNTVIKCFRVVGEESVMLKSFDFFQEMKNQYGSEFKIPEIITMSDTKRFQFKPSYVSWRTVTDHLLDLEMVHTNSIGNNGEFLTGECTGTGSASGTPIPWNIATPGNSPSPWLHPDQDPPINTGVSHVSSAISVGATNSNDNIVDKSSRGPAAWEDIQATYPCQNAIPDSLWDYRYDTGNNPLIKPDVTAPSGDGMRSTAIHDPNEDPVFWYGLYDGTSAATPHVAGTAALLLEVNELLTPADVSRILQMSAVDLGAPGKNNEYGAGRIDAYGAVLFTLEHYGGDLGMNSDKVVFTDPLTIQEEVAIGFWQDVEVETDVEMAAGSRLTLEARDGSVTIQPQNGSVSIGVPGGSSQAKFAGVGTQEDPEQFNPETAAYFELSNNYPNPFNPVTTIRYELPVNSNVRLEVFDILGRRVAVLVDGMIEAGVHEVTFNASNLASGVYLYRLSTADFVQTRQMVLVK